MERIKKWHERNGYKPSYNIDELLKNNFIAMKAGAFTILVEAAGKKYHGNAAISVYNEKGVIVDDRVYYNPLKNQKVPRKTFMGTPIVDGSKPMSYQPLRKKDSPFRP